MKEKQRIRLKWKRKEFSCRNTCAFAVESKMNVYNIATVVLKRLFASLMNAELGMCRKCTFPHYIDFSSLLFYLVCFFFGKYIVGELITAEWFFMELCGYSFEFTRKDCLNTVWKIPAKINKQKKKKKKRLAGNIVISGKRATKKT